MTDRRLRTTGEAPAVDRREEGMASLRHRHAPPSPLSDRLARPHSREEAEDRYVAARDAWTDAMRAAGSGRPADLAALAMAQEAYEAALAERDRWATGPSVAVPIQRDRPSGLDAVVGQELSWRRVHEHEIEKERARSRRGLLGRLFRR